MYKEKEVKRCKYCKRILRDYNKSYICSSCRNIHRFEFKKPKQIHSL